MIKLGAGLDQKPTRRAPPDFRPTGEAGQLLQHQARQPRNRKNEKVDAIADKFSTPTYTLDIAEMLPSFFELDVEGGILTFRQRWRMQLAGIRAMGA